MELSSWVAGVMMLASSMQPMQLMVPAYFYPTPGGNQSEWTAIRTALDHGVGVTAIMNVASGPGQAPNADYSAAIRAFRAAGGRVLGYVYTCYAQNTCVAGGPAKRSPEDVLRDVAKYAAWYEIDGIFLDEMATSASALPFYSAISRALRRDHPSWQLVGNAGAAAPKSYLSIVDSIVTFEGSGSDYANAATMPWAAAESPQRQVNLLYNVASVEAMQNALRTAVARNAGYIYITDDRFTPGAGDPAENNPWDRLASYWGAEVSAVRALRDDRPDENKREPRTRRTARKH